MGELKQHNMKTLLLLSILGLALVSADLQTEEDRYTEEADVVAVDDSAEAMDDLDDNTRRSGSTSRWAKFRFGDDLTADIKVRQSNSEKEKNNARWTSKLNKFNDDICPGGELNWHVHQYPVSETTSSNIRRASPMTAQIENFNIQHAPITYFASDSGALKGGLPAPYLPTTVTGSAATSITSDGKIRLDWTLTGLDDNSSGGIHIHYGTTCDTEATVKGDAPAGASKGHYYVPTDANAVTQGEDPWADVKWISDGDGNADGFVEISEAQLGAAAVSAYDRVVIVHNNAGGKIGCGVLSYVPTTVTGSATASTTSDGKLRLDWTLSGLEDNSSGGIHIHYGTTCQSEATVKGDAPAGANKGHYYAPSSSTVVSSEDPWGPVTWSSDADGNADGSVEISEADLEPGTTPASAYNRVVVVHNNAGKKVGCGVLSLNAPGCGKGVTGGHYDPTFACGGASQNNANGICAILRATDQAPAGNGLVKGAYACTNADQSQCEIGDQSGKMGKIIGVDTGGGARRRRRRATTQKFNDRWMEPITNLDGKSLVLHCCSTAGCGARLACANLE